MSGDNSSAPDRLYKYRPFNANTLRLLSQAETYYADPSHFNDPLDCKPVISVDTDTTTLEQVFSRVVSQKIDEDTALKAMGSQRYNSTQYGDYQSDRRAADVYRRGLASTIQSLLNIELERCGVLSLAARWNCPLMWSHYADKHRGLCIAYDLKDHECKNLCPVDYDTPGNIKISDIYKWKIDASGEAEKAIRQAFYYAKAKEWRYEREWRDVKESPGAVEIPMNIAAVYFGLRCDEAILTTVIKLFSNASQPIEFFKIDREDDSFQLKCWAIDAQEIELFGLRTPVLREFRQLKAVEGEDSTSE